MAGIGSRSDYPKLYAQRLAYIYDLIGADDWPESEQTWQELFNIKESSRMREEFLYLGGFGRFDKMSENTAVTYDTLVQGPSHSISHTLYGLGYTIGYLEAKDDLDGVIKRKAPEIGYAYRKSIQYQAAEFWNGVGDTYKSADGKFVIANNHTYVRGSGTFSNLSASTLGHGSLESALVQFRKQKDLSGDPQPLPVASILTAPDLEPIIHELLTSRLRSDTTTHAESFNFGKVKHISWPWFTGTTYWILLAPKNTLKIYWFWRVHPETSHGFDFDKAAAKTKMLYSSSTIGVDPRGVYGYVAT